MSPTEPLVFDGHNDVLTRLLLKPEEGRIERFLAGETQGHLDLPRMREGGFCGGFFAIYVPSREAGVDINKAMASAPFRIALPPEVPLEAATPFATREARLLFELERRADGALRIARDSAELRRVIDAGAIGVILHVEGAEIIDEDLDRLHLWHAAGLRSLGPVWSRPTRFAHGVPMRFPGDPDTGEGLTAAGVRLVRECHRLGIVVDLSHLNARGFDDVAAIGGAPLVATHSNAHALCPSSRNLTDRQLDAIRDSDGMVGVNFATAFLREDGRMDRDTPLETLYRHVEYLVDRVGETRVGFGSDFDGALVPKTIGSVAGLPALRQCLRDHGVGEESLRRLCHGNWLALLERTIG